MKQPSRWNVLARWCHLAGIMTAPMPAQWASPGGCALQFTFYLSSDLVLSLPDWYCWDPTPVSFPQLNLHLRGCSFGNLDQHDALLSSLPSSLTSPSPFSFLSFFFLVCRTTSLDQEKQSKSYWEKFNLHPAVSTVLLYHTMEKFFILSEQGVGQHFFCKLFTSSKYFRLFRPCGFITITQFCLFHVKVTADNLWIRELGFVMIKVYLKKTGGKPGLVH